MLVTTWYPGIPGCIAVGCNERVIVPGMILHCTISTTSYTNTLLYVFVHVTGGESGTLLSPPWRQTGFC